MTVTVYILTTQGPVHIQRISEETPGVQSVICLDGRAQALPISSRYDAFVRSPTGVIERATGHGAYRMDVDQMIDDGDSWQLGAYLAHVTENVTEKDVHIFATGEVDRDLKVRPVSRVAEKLEKADELIRRLHKDGQSIRVFVPKSDEVTQLGCQNISFDAVAHVDQVFELLGIVPPAPPVSGRISKQGPLDRQEYSSRRFLWALPVILLVGWFLWAPINWLGLADEGEILELEQTIIEESGTFVGKFQRRLFLFIQSYRSPDPTKPELLGKMTIAENDQNCEAGGDQHVTAWDTNISISDTICELVVQADMQSNDGVIIGRLGYWPEGLGEGGKPERTMRGSSRPAGHIWALKFERFPTQDALVRLVILKGLVPPSGAQPWYATLLSEPEDSTDFKAAKARVERLGYRVFVHDWKRP